MKWVAFKNHNLVIFFFFMQKKIFFPLQSMHNAHCTSTFDVRRKVSHINRGKDIIFICSSSSHKGVYVHFEFCYFRTCEDGFSYSYSSHYTTVPNMQVSNDSGNYDDVDDVDCDVDLSPSSDDHNGDL